MHRANVAKLPGFWDGRSIDHLIATIGADDHTLHCKGVVVSTCDAESFAELRRLLKQNYGERTKSKHDYGERTKSNQSIIPAIKMAIGDWYVDELGVWTREIKARD
jgi:hypothetical protein